MCGDFFQLPPVEKGSQQEKFFCFESKSWSQVVTKG